MGFRGHNPSFSRKSYTNLPSHDFNQKPFSETQVPTVNQYQLLFIIITLQNINGETSKHHKNDVRRIPKFLDSRTPGLQHGLALSYLDLPFKAPNWLLRNEERFPKSKSGKVPCHFNSSCGLKVDFCTTEKSQDLKDPTNMGMRVPQIYGCYLYHLICAF